MKLWALHLTIKKKNFSIKNIIEVISSHLDFANEFRFLSTIGLNLSNKKLGSKSEQNLEKINFYLRNTPVKELEIDEIFTSKQNKTSTGFINFGNVIVRTENSD